MSDLCRLVSDLCRICVDLSDLCRFVSVLCRFVSDLRGIGVELCRICVDVRRMCVDLCRICVDVCRVVWVGEPLCPSVVASGGSKSSKIEGRRCLWRVEILKKHEKCDTPSVFADFR